MLFLRIAFAAVAFFASAGLCAASGRAATEYCGAGVTAFPVSPRPSGDASDVYALSLNAKSARTVSGTVMLRADNGWYAADFKDVKIEPRPDRYRTPNLSFTRTDFVSDYLYVRFPADVQLLSSYVSRASVSHDALSHWDGAMHECYAYDSSQIEPAAAASPSGIEFVNEPPKPALAPGSTVLQAKAAPAPGQADCADAFSQASVTEAVAPQWPLGYSATAELMELVRVTVGPQGELDDAVVWVPTGSTAFDEAGLAAARASKYKAARAFCKDVPGDYLFRVMFRPH